jgi:hypothetical protein
MNAGDSWPVAADTFRSLTRKGDREMATAPRPDLDVPSGELRRVADAMLGAHMMAAWSPELGSFRLDEPLSIPVDSALFFECIEVFRRLLSGGKVVSGRKGRHAIRLRELQDRLRDYYRAVEYEKRLSLQLSKRKSRKQAAEATGDSYPSAIRQAMTRRAERTSKPFERPSPIEYLMLKRSAPKPDA